MHKIDAIAVDRHHHGCLGKGSDELTAQINAGNLQHIFEYQECGGATPDQQLEWVQAVGEDSDPLGRGTLSNQQCFGGFGLSTNHTQSAPASIGKQGGQDRAIEPSG